MSSLARVFYGSSNAIVGAASAYIAGHRVVYLRVRRAWIARQQRNCRHDLPRLTISALNDVMIEPSLLHLPASRSLADGFDSSHCGLQMIASSGRYEFLGLSPILEGPAHPIHFV